MKWFIVYIPDVQGSKSGPIKRHGRCESTAFAAQAFAAGEAVVEGRIPNDGKKYQLVDGKVVPKD
jgi:hypothetical protein